MMPCNSDYLAPTGLETESQRAAQLLLYTLASLNVEVPGWVAKAASHIYGDTERADEIVSALCEFCQTMNAENKQRIIYDAHSRQARDLANWWEEHQEADADRLAKEAETKRVDEMKHRALAKLTDEEKAALGL